MIEQACREMDLDPARSVMVGDRWLDVPVAGRAVRARGARAHRSRRAQRTDAPDGVHADAILNNLMEAVGWILRSSSR